MYVDSSSSTTHGKTYWRHLLRRSFREGGKVKHETVANLSACSSDEIEAIRLALRHKGDLPALLQQRPALSLRQGLAVGAVWVAFDLARQLGIQSALGEDRQGRLALWQVIAEILECPVTDEQVRLCGFSVVSQCLFYKHCHPVVCRLFPEHVKMDVAGVDRLTDHITRFSLTAMKHLPSPKKKVL